MMNKEKIISLTLVGAIGLGSCMPAMAMQASDEPDAKRVGLGSSQSSRLTAMEVAKRYTPRQTKKYYENARKPMKEKEDIKEELFATLDSVYKIINEKVEEIRENAEKKREAAEKECKETIEDLEATRAEVYQKYEEAGGHPTEEDIAELEKAKEEADEKVGEAIEAANRKLHETLEKIDLEEREQIDAIEEVREKIEELEKILREEFGKMLVNEEVLVEALKKVENAFTKVIGPKERAKAINEFIALVDRINKVYSEALHAGESSLGSLQSSKLTAMEVEAEADEVEADDMEVLKKDTLKQAKKYYENARKPMKEKEDIKEELFATLDRVYKIINEKVEDIVEDINEKANKKREAAEKKFEEIREKEAEKARVWCQEYEKACQYIAELEAKLGEQPKEKDIAEIKEAIKDLAKLEKAKEEACKKVDEAIEAANRELNETFEKIGLEETEQIDAIKEVREKIEELGKILREEFGEVRVNEEVLVEALKNVGKAFTEGIGPEERAKAINEFIALVDGINKMYSEAPHAGESSLGSSQSSRLTAMEVDEDNDMKVLKRYTSDYRNAQWKINRMRTLIYDIYYPGSVCKLRDAAGEKIEEIDKNAEIEKAKEYENYDKTRKDLDATGAEVYQKYKEACRHLAELEKAGKHPAEIKEARRKFEELGKALEEAGKKIDEAVDEHERKIAEIDATAEKQKKAIEDVRSEVGEVSKMLYSKLLEVMDNKLKMLDTAYTTLYKTLSTEGIGPEERAKAINEFIALVKVIDEIYREAPRITRAAGELIGKYVLCKAIYGNKYMFFKQIGDFDFKITVREDRWSTTGVGSCLFGEMVNKTFEGKLLTLIDECTKYNETKRMYEKAKASTVVAEAEAEYRARKAAYNKAKALSKEGQEEVQEEVQEELDAHARFSSMKRYSIMQSVDDEELRWAQTPIVGSFEGIIKRMKGAAKRHMLKKVAKAADGNQAEADDNQTVAVAGAAAKADNNQAEVDAGAAAKAADNQAEVDAGEVAEADDNQAEVDAGAAAEADNNQAEE